MGGWGGGAALLGGRCAPTKQMNSKAETQTVTKQPLRRDRRARERVPDRRQKPEGVLALRLCPAAWTDAGPWNRGLQSAAQGRGPAAHAPHPWGGGAGRWAAAVGVAVVWRTQTRPPPARGTKPAETKARPTPVALGEVAAFLLFSAEAAAAANCHGHQVTGSRRRPPRAWQGEGWEGREPNGDAAGGRRRLAEGGQGGRAGVGTREEWEVGGSKEGGWGREPGEGAGVAGRRPGKGGQGGPNA